MGVPWEDAQVATLANELCNKYHGKDAPIEYLLGMHTVQTFEAALKMAMKDVGFENVDGAAIKQALDSMDKADIGHGSPISFADHEGDREGPALIRLLRWDAAKGQPVTVADWFEPFTFPELYG